MNLYDMSGYLFIIAGSIVAMFWNVENFFDFREGKQSRGHFYAKCEGICKEILRVSDEEGALPDIVGFAEVENAFTLKQIIYSTVLRKTDYSPIHFDSPDHRGIDCALLFRRDRLRLISSKPCHITDSTGAIMPTRDILLACFMTSDSVRINVLINHHPSKYGGNSSGYGRKAAMERMLQIRDSLSSSGGIFLSMGDFNEEPGEILSGLRDLGIPLKEQGKGSIRFNGKWELIDRCFVTDTVNASMRVFMDPAITVKDRTFGGEKPRRTSSGPFYQGGLSDHYPVIINLFY